MSAQNSIQKQLELTSRHKQVLEEQLAAYGGINVPPHIIIGIEEAQKKIEELSGSSTSGPVQSYLRALKLRFDEYLPLAEPVDLGFQPGSNNPAKTIPAFQQKLLARFRAEQKIQPHYATSPDPKAEKTSVEEFLVKNSRVVLLGSPGAGKSTTLRQLALRWLEPEKLPKKLRAKTPIFAALNAWDKSLSLKQFLTKQLTEAGGQEVAERMANLLDERQALLLLDGLNELPGGIERDEKTNEITDKRVREIKEICQIKNLACLLSCRVKDFGKATNWYDLHVLPLEREQVEKIAAAFFLGDDGLKTGFVHELYEKKREKNRQEKLQEIAAQPFYLLNVLAYFYQFKNLPDSPTLALQYSVEAALEKLPLEQVNELKEKLSLLAFNMTEALEVGVGLDLAAEWLSYVREKYNTQKLVVSPAQVTKTQELLKFGEGTYLINELNGRVQFRHQLLQDYFCALCLKDWLESPLFFRARSNQFREIWPLLAKLDNEWIGQLKKGLNSGNSSIRINTVEILSWIGDIDIIEPIIQTLNDKNSQVRNAAADALLEMGEPAIELLVKKLNVDESFVRYRAIQALRRFQDANVIEPLIQALKDQDTDVRISAVEALHHFKEVEPLIQALKDQDENVCCEAAFALSEIRDVRALEPLIQTLNHKNSNVRRSAANALGELGDTMAVEPLFRTLKDKNDMVSDVAARALSKLGKSAIVLLIQELKNEDRFARYRAAKALQNFRDPSLIEPLIMALKDIDSDVRFEVTFALGEICDDRAVEPLIQILWDKDEHLRSSTAEALGNLGDDRAIEPLIHTLNDEAKKVRSQAAEALGKICNTSALPALEALREDTSKIDSWPYKTVGDVAEKAIRKIRAKNGL